MKVLAVDDNPDNVELIADIIEALGYEVLKAFDGYQALAQAQTQAPDLILLDVNMPGMTGFEVVTKLKQDAATAKIPVIMLTALADVDYRVEGLQLGAEDYLTKPYSPKELIARVETRLRAKSETDALRATQQLIRTTFERFVSPSVVNQLLENPASVRLGGKLQEITVFFADLQGFTSISEHTEPEELLHILNQYHELIVAVIQANGGTIDKFIGDAVMALYNTPLETDNHPMQAVLSAYEIREALAGFYQSLETRFQMKVNFGIHTGRAVVGNVGAPQIMDFTALGDTVNVAARLQGQSHGGQILISETTYNHIQGDVEANLIGPISLKGRSHPVMTYEVVTLKRA